MTAEPWHYECKGKSRAGDRKGNSTLHVWKRLPNGLGQCSKCGITLTAEETANCFREH